jgi:hypothetical protein
MTKKIKDIEREIEWYKIRKPVAKGMIELGKMGFEVSGHGCGFGGEDFGLFSKKFSVNLCDTRRSCVVSVYKMDHHKPIFEGTISKAINFITNHG